MNVTANKNDAILRFWWGRLYGTGAFFCGRHSQRQLLRGVDNSSSKKRK